MDETAENRQTVYYQVLMKVPAEDRLVSLGCGVVQHLCFYIVDLGWSAVWRERELGNCSKLQEQLGLNCSGLPTGALPRSKNADRS